MSTPLTLIVPPISIEPSIPDDAFITPLSSAFTALTKPSVSTSKLDPTLIVPPVTWMSLAFTYPALVTENLASSFAFAEYPPATPPPAQNA